MKGAHDRSRVFLPDAPRLRQVLGLLAEDGDRELLLQLAGRPVDASTLARRMGKAPRTLQSRLLRLVRGDLVASSQVKGKRIYRLAVGVAVELRAGRLTVRVANPGGSKATLVAPYSSTRRLSRRKRPGSTAGNRI